MSIEVTQLRLSMRALIEVNIRRDFLYLREISTYMNNLVREIKEEV